MIKNSLLLSLASAVFAGSIGATALQPRVASPVSPADAGVGRKISLLTGVDLKGAKVSLPMSGSGLTVVAYTGVSCPLCLKLAPTLAELEDLYKSKGVRFVFVNPSEVEKPAEMKTQAKKLGFDGPYVHDPKGKWTAALGAKTTTEAFVLNSQGKVLYRGAVDDQYAVGASLPQPKNRFLANALDSLLTGKSPKVKATNAPGCVLDVMVEEAEVVPTFHASVQPIIQKYCLPCHRPEGVAPFSLDTYESVKGRAPMIRYVLKEGIMPPWFAAKNTGPWRNDMSIPDEEKAILSQWLESDMPKGDIKDAPAPVTFSGEWTIGKPDATLQLPTPIAIKATGTMAYQNINVPTGFSEEKWIQKVEVIPGDRRVVHHVLVFAIPREADGSPGRAELDEIAGFFAAYVPGNSSLVYPDGLAKRLPANCDLRFQIHYTPNGTATTDQTKIGLVFAKKAPESEVHTTSLANLSFAIPAGAPNHLVTAQMRVPKDVKVLSYLPHMHVRGKAARYEMKDPEGKESLLLDVPRYDFNWQLNYVYPEPKLIKAGTQLTYHAWYDNSDKNPSNPDPTKTVYWGPQTFHEMHLGYLEYIVPGEKPGSGDSGIRRAGAAGGASLEQIFKRLDRDGDGFVTKTEALLFWERIKDADANGDGKITLAEAKEHFGG